MVTPEDTGHGIGSPPDEAPLYMRPPKEIRSSRILHVAGVGATLGTSKAGVVDLLADLGLDPARLDDDDADTGEPCNAIHMLPGRGYIFARFRDEQSAEAAKGRLEGYLYKGRRLVVHYAVPFQDKAPVATDPECPSLTAHVTIPGLALIEDFVTEEEEAALLALTDADGGSHWQDVISRRVQHYGYKFAYTTRDVDYGAKVPAIPAACQEYIRRALSRLPRDMLPAPPDQLTVNEYLPGQGISPHVETHTDFKDGLLSLSLGTACVMDFRRSGCPETRKSLLLPPRSLLVISGEARYTWSHGIAWRTWDKVAGARMDRGRRVSLTFRRVLPSGVCFCAYPEVCESSEDDRERRRHQLRNAQVEPESVQPTDVEREYVHAVYETIAPHWNHTRAIRRVHWPRVKEFLAMIPPYSLIADVGCGDGKYLDLKEMGNPTCVALGCDRSLRLLQLSNQGGRGYELTACDVLKLPYRSGAFDAAFCTAVLHHMSTEAHRLQALRELARLIRIGGLLDIQVWAMEQEQGSRRRFEEQDVLVPWKMQAKYADPSWTARLSASQDQQQQQQQQATDSNTTGGGSGGGNDNGGSQEEEAEGTSTGPSVPDYDPVAKLITYKRYCHMYREWEIEGLIESLAPEIRFEVIDRGYDKGNWFVRLRKVSDETEA